MTKSTKETKKFAQEIAKDLVGNKKTQDSAIVIALEGDLGSGKTTFSQGFLSYFGIKRVTSPTFVIMKKYSIKNPKSEILNPKQIQNSKFKIQNLALYHIDCYRVHNSRDLSELGIEDIIKNPENIVLIEWADRIRDILPDNTIWIKFEHKSESERIIRISNSPN